MPTKVVRTRIGRPLTPAKRGGRGSGAAPRSLVDEAFARIWRNKFNRLKPLGTNLDTNVEANVADVLESYSTKLVT